MIKAPSMSMRYSELTDKEVINIYDGCRIGRICDIEIDTLCGRINCVFIPTGGFSLRKRKCQMVKWEQIERIGCDTVLVRMPKNPPPKPHEK